MQELFPLACGLLLGVTLGFIRPTLRLAIGAGLAIVLGPDQGGGEQGAAKRPDLDERLQRIGIYGGSGRLPCP